MTEKTSASTTDTDRASMNKMDCVKKALETLGYEARPVDIRDHIKKNFNVEMTTDHISANKSTILKKQGKSMPSAKTSAPAAAKATMKPAPKKKVKRKPANAPKITSSTAKVSMTATKASASAKSVDLSLQQEAQTVKGLVDRLGKDNLQTLINLVSK